MLIFLSVIKHKCLTSGMELFNRNFALSLHPKKQGGTCNDIFLVYDGAAYHGCQIQPNAMSVWGCLMEVLSTP